MAYKFNPFTGKFDQVQSLSNIPDTGWKVTNVVEDKDLNLSSFSIDELGHIVGTLINTLIDAKILSGSVTGGTEGSPAGLLLCITQET